LLIFVQPSLAPFLSHFSQRKQTWGCGERNGAGAGGWSLLSALSCGRNLIFAKNTQMKATPRAGERRKEKEDGAPKYAMPNYAVCESACVCVRAEVHGKMQNSRGHTNANTHTHAEAHPHRCIAKYLH